MSTNESPKGGGVVPSSWEAWEELYFDDDSVVVAESGGGSPPPLRREEFKKGSENLSNFLANP